MNKDLFLKEMQEHEFREVQAGDWKLFEVYYQDMNDYWVSPMSFTNMMAWRSSFRIFYKRVDSYLLCMVWDHRSDDRFLMVPLLGHYEQSSITKIMTEVQSFFQKMGVPLIVESVSEWMLPYYQNLPDFNWQVENDRDLSDYLYQAKDFEASMDMKKTRYYYRYFIRENQPKTIELSSEYAEECIELCERAFCGTHTCEDCGFGCLKNTIRSVLQDFHLLNAKGILVRKGEQAIAYCIVSRLKGLGMYQFKKTERGYQGINEYLHKECYDRFLQGVDVINYMEDMGLEGLRKYKSRLAPYTLFPRYRLELKP